VPRAFHRPFQQQAFLIQVQVAVVVEQVCAGGRAVRKCIGAALLGGIEPQRDARWWL
jgi:hypothetical protein